MITKKRLQIESRVRRMKVVTVIPPGPLDTPAFLWGLRNTMQEVSLGRHMPWGAGDGGKTAQTTILQCGSMCEMPPSRHIGNVP